MPLAVGISDSNSSNVSSFESSNTYKLIASLFESLINSRVLKELNSQFALDEDEEHLIQQDIPLFCQTILKAPFHVDVFLCLDEFVHVPLERWTLSLIESSEPPSPSFFMDLHGTDVSPKSVAALENSLSSFLRLLPFYTYTTAPNRAFPWKVKYGKTISPVQLKTDDLTNFTFQTIETSFGKFTMSVDYLSHVNVMIEDMSTPYLVVRPSQSYTIAECNCGHTLSPILATPKTPDKDSSWSGLSWSLTSSSTPNSSLNMSMNLSGLSSSVSTPLGKLAFSDGQDILGRGASLPMPTPTNSLIPSKPKLNTTPSFSPPRPGTPPPSQRLLARSAPVGIPSRPRNSTPRSSIPLISPPRPLSISVPSLTASDEDHEEEETTEKQRRRSLGSSPSELSHFVGSFQESLLSGHMSNTQCTTYEGFGADLASSGPNFIGSHIKIPFSAIYYHVEHDTPYVGTIELDKKGYKVPPKGMVQLTITNPSLTPIKTFLVKYDLTEMPPLTKTFVRQKTIATNPHILRYAIHLKFVSPKKNRYYLYKSIRVVFAHRVPDDMENLRIMMDYPDEPKYFPYSKGSSASRTSLRRSLSSSGEQDDHDMDPSTDT